MPNNDPYVSDLYTLTEVDLDTNLPFISVVHAKQYDTVRQVKANLFYNGVKWDVPENNIFAMVAYKKSDGIGGFYDETEDSRTAVTVDGQDRSIIYLLLDRNLLTTVGNVKTEVTFYDIVSGGRLTTFSFITQVEEASITELDLASNPYFNVLAEDITAAVTAGAKADAIVGLTATATKVAPDASNITPTVTGGPTTNPPSVYNIDFKIPTFYGITATAVNAAPGATGNAIKPTVTGGGSSASKYNIEFKIPTFPGVNTTGVANTLQPGSQPTVSVSGGSSSSDKYTFTFGIPKGDPGSQTQPTRTDVFYAVGDSTLTPPSTGWNNNPPPTPVKGSYYWSKAITSWDNNTQTTLYAVSYIGVDGDGATAAQIATDTAGVTVQTALNNLNSDVTQLNSDVGDLGSDLVSLQSDVSDLTDELNDHDLVINIGSFSSLPKTISNSKITSDHVVSEFMLSSPIVQTTDWTVTTSAGQAVISGSINGATTARLILIKATAISA